MLKVNPSHGLTTKSSTGKSGMSKLPMGHNATGKSTTAPAGDKQNQRKSMLRWFD